MFILNLHLYQTNIFQKKKGFKYFIGYVNIFDVDRIPLLIKLPKK